MGYRFEIEGGYRIKAKEKAYPWPCQSDGKRVITIFNDDVLTRDEDGSFIKHTGLGCFNIHIPDEDVEPIGEAVKLQMM